MKTVLDPIKADSLKEVFISRFEELILSGRVAIGERLPSERELALQLGVSRPVVHEGLVDLAFKGMVTMVPRVGTIVNDYRREGSLALLTSLIKYQKGNVDPKLLNSMLEIRELIEVDIVRRAARNRSDEHLETLEMILRNEQTMDAKHTEQIAELDFAFHHQLAMASENLIYPLLLNTFKQFYTSLSGLFFSDVAVRPVVLGYHRRILDSIAAGNSQAAVEDMQSMLEHGAQRIKQLTRDL